MCQVIWATSRKHRDDAKRFPCKYCKKYRGSNGFKRRDHLVQHVRNYHHIGEDSRGHYDAYALWCPSIGCSDHADSPNNVGKRQAFHNSTQYIKHLRTVHDQSDLPCPQPGCDRVNSKGYFRPADLRNHLRKVHGTDGSLGGDRI
ncbi:hypothetical protein COCC4DRAFT_159232 [Bipolaris maydis ATCC 48331]|uniref:C2H2-type domain-containing protein n=2 Tax=Cochliobolus heterostrophus TaxID=5016 RepID=M2TW96_COCH5|nr:uncharacterized protein COCC4DRAFT_159232 [Bipolaris maydis ATCC 48331]EMD90784.1 hypothetical protein COCHEDRAFT_1195921 [Bipolaris maydis C5]ENI09006.1 hypothetical protein COCC4DRAFT_159232 [Bipolaris maydis ATCC 48331]KAJ6206663.1 hypothetical protein PSV09DRAFT_1195921 [Bipolaris maydis]